MQKHEQEIGQTARMLRDSAEINLPRTPDMLAAYRNENLLFGLVSNFQNVAGDLNNFIEGSVPEIQARIYPNSWQFKQEVHEMRQINLVDIFEMFESKEYRRYVLASGTRVFKDLKSEIDSGEWNLGSKPSIAQPSQLAARLLLRGWAILVEKIEEKPGLRDNAELAFAEMLINKHQDSLLYVELFPWLNEQRDKFSRHIQSKLPTSLKPF